MRPVSILLLLPTALAAQEYNLALLHANYGQRTAQRELRAFHDIADHYRVPDDHRLVIDQTHLARIGGSALTDERQPIPPADLASSTIPSTYV
ncbi:MAG: 7-cyano-7-deazaguanine synthase, partial [Fidelibacterota bacterium]